jgi:hypothetical protein
MRHRVSAAGAVRAGSALLQGMQAILLLTLLPWLDMYDDDYYYYYYYHHDDDPNDVRLPPLDGVDGNRTNDDNNYNNTNSQFRGEPFDDAQRLLIAVLALGAVCPGIAFAWRVSPSSARWWGHPPRLLQWIECSVACPLTLLVLAVELGIRPPRDAYLLEALVALAW